MFGAVIRLCSRGLSLTVAPGILDSFNHSFPPDPSDADVALLSVFRGILGEKKTARSGRSGQKNKNYFNKNSTIFWQETFTLKRLPLWIMLGYLRVNQTRSCRR